MKICIAITASCLACLGFCTASGSDLGPKVLFEVRSLGKGYHFELNGDNCPPSSWKGDGAPPLSLEQAIQKAKDGLKSLYGIDQARELISVELCNLSEGSTRWFYRVRFGITKGAVVIGKVERVEVAVTMNGEIIHPNKVE
jgi:hypothetical protein